MRIIIVIILSIILTAFLVQLYFINKERGELQVKLDDLSSRFATLSQENIDLQSEIEYFSQPENLEKELRAKFNYRKPGEEMIIIVP